MDLLLLGFASGAICGAAAAWLYLIESEDES